ncbi:uroporphyrinogen-III C-methyltransferase [Nocardia australiensis]|uniref:uroporphyrinogen-III C-methyltransferase n=1 Tax=Nocardia australiensis TaxID=2887191 RepID=UPI001D13B97D|nr:uroporphyrinogen-III C-methyltransferase [Nocardia australiensis]
MSAPDGYSVQLPVADRPVTVITGAEVEDELGWVLGHVAGLQTAGAKVTVVAPEVTTAIADLAQRRLVTWHHREHTSKDLADAWLVVAATGDHAADRAIAQECARRHIWCLVPPPPVGTGSGVGRVTLVGGGPGDPGLLTVAGLEALRSADVVVADRLGPLATMAELSPHSRVIDVGKVPYGRATSQEEINRILVKEASAGRHVVRLKGGDNFLFGRGGEELQELVRAGVDVTVVPGVTSALAVPASARIPVTHRGLSQGVTIISGHVPPGDPRSTVDYQALARSGTSLVLLMAVTNLRPITAALQAAGMPPSTPAATVADGTLPAQRVVRASLGELADAVADAGIAPPAVTVIGAVAAFAAASDT